MVKRFKYAFPNAAAVVDALYGQASIGAIPGVGHGLTIARDSLKSRAVTGAAVDEPFGARKIDGIAPDRGQAYTGFVDEVVQIIFPAAVEVAEEEQPPAIVDDGPVGKVNARNTAQLAVSCSCPG